MLAEVLHVPLHQQGHLTGRRDMAQYGAVALFIVLAGSLTDVIVSIPYARQPRTLPVVLSADEVVRFREAVPSLKTRTALTTAYADRAIRPVQSPWMSFRRLPINASNAPAHSKSP
jgi:hypothetical protein